CCETWMVPIGVGESECQAPTRSRIRRLAWDSATGRSAAGADFCLCTSKTALPCRCSSKAKAQPTGPAPWMATSGRIAFQRFDVRDALGRFAGDDLASAFGHQRIVLDADADAVQRLRHIVSRANVEPGFHGQHHAGGERAPLAGALVFARVVHVQPEPVTSTVHVEALVSFLLER